MSNFSDACRQQAAGAWQLTTTWPQRYAAWKRSPSVGGRAQRGCVGFLFFGIAYIVLPLTVFLVVELAVVAYALVMSILWGVGAAVDGLTSRKRPAGGS